ncbi:hypothetical protein HRW23_11745 [Streptomyces lunaelactis]|uniref:hypothetical protein n=1 Tax=Streptomyces lunaelactis TaxID=1535768 RepID=UPI001585752B|nr:hypothetical protein [Streptomyces lunaelactis]
MDASAFPDDLVQAQRDFNATYQALAAPGRHGYTELRRRLLRLSVRILWHPFWTAHPAGAPAARIELRRQARTDRSEVRAA